MLHTHYRPHAPTQLVLHAGVVADIREFGDFVRASRKLADHHDSGPRLQTAPAQDFRKTSTCLLTRIRHCEMAGVVAELLVDRYHVHRPTRRSDPPTDVRADVQGGKELRCCFELEEVGRRVRRTRRHDADVPKPPFICLRNERQHLAPDGDLIEFGIK